VLVEEIMHRGIQTTTGTATLEEAARALRVNDISSVLVVKESRPVGIVTERDIVAAVAEGVDVSAALVGEWMTRGVATVHPATAIPDAIDLFKKWGIRHLPVVEDEVVVGMISVRDVMSWAATQAEDSPDIWSDLMADAAVAWPH